MTAQPRDLQSSATKLGDVLKCLRLLNIPDDFRSVRLVFFQDQFVLAGSS